MLPSSIEGALARSRTALSPERPRVTAFARRDGSNAAANASLDIHPHRKLKIPVETYIDQTAKELHLRRQYNWRHAQSPFRSETLLNRDPWKPDAAQWPEGYAADAAGTTEGFARCWRFAPESQTLLDRLLKPQPPKGFNPFLVISGVTWWFASTNTCSTSLIARLEGKSAAKSQEDFMMGLATQLLADIQAWIEGPR